jgi:hypothetical protein
MMMIMMNEDECGTTGGMPAISVELIGAPD